jgi:hypothetical protein
VILLVNAKINIQVPTLSPILSGQYTDFSVGWYTAVGSTLILSMIINIIAPHFSAIFKQVFFGFFRCWDRGCTLNKRRTRKLHQDDYEEQYLGIEFYIECRYAQIISTTYILMIYSSGMPILYIIGSITFFVMYWFDKYCCKLPLFMIMILVVRIYKAPPRYGVTLANMSRNLLSYSVLFHLGFGFYMFSNSSIFN